jgi:hypothetical protein
VRDVCPDVLIIPEVLWYIKSPSQIWGFLSLFFFCHAVCYYDLGLVSYLPGPTRHSFFCVNSSLLRGRVCSCGLLSNHRGCNACAGLKEEICHPEG